MAGQGVEVGVNFFLENEAEIARAIAATGGKMGRTFSDALSDESKKAFDELTAAADKAAKGVGVKFSQVDLKFKSNAGQFLTPQELERLSKSNEAFKQAVDSVNKFRAAVDNAGKSSQQSFNLIEAAVEGVAISLTSKLTDALGTSLGSLRGLIGGFIDLDGELRLAAAAAGETGGYERLGAIVDKVGIEAAGTTKQVAELATSLVRAGFSVKEIETALPGVVRGAEATGTSFASFGDIVGNTLRGFGLDVEQTGHVVDVLTNTANSSNASIEGLGYTFEYTAPIAKALGVSLEEVAAAAGLMANAGIQGSVAGTGLRTGLQKIQQAAGGASPEVMGLARGQERLTGVMRKLGAQVVDTNGKLLPLDKVFISLKSGLEKLNQADQVQLANVLFGDEAGSKFLAILNQSDAAISKMFRDMRSSAGAADTARTAMSGMGLEVQQLTGTLDSLGVQLGGVAAAGLRPFVGILNGVLGAISAMPAPIKTAASALIILTAASTATTIAVMATNAAITQLGGFAALRAGATAAAASVAKLGAGTSIVLALAAGLAVLSGNFKETDRTTKQLLQTTIALGVGIATYKGTVIALSVGIATYKAITQSMIALNIAQTALNVKTKGYAVLLAFVQALNPGKALVALAIAGTVAAATYATLDSMIKVTGEDTEGLTKQSTELKDEIRTVQDQIEKSKKLNLDTNEAQRKLDTLQAQLQKIETPLELKLDIQQVEQQVKGLEAALGKLGANAPQRGPLEAELAARKAFLDVLKAADEGINVDRMKDASRISKEIIRDTTAFRNELDKLTKERISLPGSDTERRNAIDRRISELQSNLARKTEREQLDLINKELQKKIQLTKQELAETERLSRLSSNTVAPLFGIVNPNVDQPAIKSREEYTGKINSLKREEQLLTQKLLANQLEIEESTKKQERTARGMVVSAKERLELAKSKLEVEQMSIVNLDKQDQLSKEQLNTIRNVAEAYSNLASAQAQLVQSRFDVQSSRNSREITEAESLLQSLSGSEEKRAANAERIRLVEEKIAYLKRQSENIEYAAMKAAIEATEARFEMERKILALKQQAQRLDQQSAIRSADQNVLAQRSRLLELQGKLADPSNIPEAKRLIQQQVDIQKQSVKLSEEQLKNEKAKSKQLEQILALDRETLDTQQQTTVNQQRASAASKGFEVALSEQLKRLDESIQKQGQANTGLLDQKKIISDINTLLKGQKDTVSGSSLAKDGRQPVGSGANRRPEAPSVTSGLNAPFGMGWKENRNSGIEELKIEGAPKRVNDAILRQARREAGRVFERELADGTIERYNSTAMRMSISAPGESLQSRRGNEKRMFAMGGMKAGEMNLTSQDEIIIENWLESEQKLRRGLAELSSQSKDTSLQVDNLTTSLRNNRDAMDDPLDVTGWKEYQDSLRGINSLFEHVMPKADAFTDVVENKITGDSLTKLHDALYSVTTQTDEATRRAEELNREYDALKRSQIGPQPDTQIIPDLSDKTKDAAESTQQLKEEWRATTEEINAAAKAAANAASAMAPNIGASIARWTGGNVWPGGNFTINELGQESWLDRLGNLRLLTAPAFSKWSPPSRGVVLPANVTAALKDRGAFSQASSMALKQSAGAQMLSMDGRGLTGLLGRLERGLASLEGAMRSYRPMDVQIVTPDATQNMAALQRIL